MSVRLSQSLTFRHSHGDDKKGGSIVTFIIVLIVVIAVVILICYNSLVKEKNRVETAEVELAKYMENGTAEDIDNAKKYYNAVVRDYNNKVEGFPTSLVADMFNFPEIHTEEFDEGL